jgi:hypothetical protein
MCVAVNSTIYALLDPNTYEVRYIGLTTRDIDTRLKEHFRPYKLKECNYKNSWLKSLIKKGQIPLIKIVQQWECIEVLELTKAEIYWVDYFKKIGCPLTNLTIGGEGITGYKHTEEAKLKISEAGKGNKYGEGYKHSKEWKKELSGRMKGNNFALRNKKTSQQKKQVSEKLKGNKNAVGSAHSEEWKKEASQRHKGNTYAKGCTPHNKGNRKYSCKWGHAYSKENTYTYNNGRRKCRKCSASQSHKRREKLRNKTP